jgi:hypothetical protein
MGTTSSGRERLVVEDLDRDAEDLNTRRDNFLRCRGWHNS